MKIPTSKSVNINNASSPQWLMIAQDRQRDFSQREGFLSTQILMSKLESFVNDPSADWKITISRQY